MMMLMMMLMLLLMMIYHAWITVKMLKNAHVRQLRVIQFLLSLLKKLIAYTLGLPHKFAAYESVLLHSNPCYTLFTAMFNHVLTEQNPFINKAIHVYTWIRDFACKIPGPSQN